VAGLINFPLIQQGPSGVSQAVRGIADNPPINQEHFAKVILPADD
jgi:hypothetical protein